MMKRGLAFITATLIIIFMTGGLCVYAREGDSGYEGGISSGEAAGKTSFEYKEVCFITGEPVVFEGTLTVKKTLKQDKNTGKNVITSNYTYSLKNLEKDATLSRFLSYTTTLTEKENGQIIEETAFGGRYTEVVKIGSTTYTLQNYDFTKTNIKDPKPAVDYFAGNLWGRKTYSTGTGANSGEVTVEISGDYYGYNQFWGTVETQVLNYIIESEKKSGGSIDRWGGTASVSISSTTTKKIDYVENIPDVISFEGGFVESQYNNSVMQYTAKLPEFDHQGMSTDRMVETKGSLMIESFPTSRRLLVPELNHLRGHWAENDIKALYSLEIFKENPASFNPQAVMTRAEFAEAIVLAASQVPKDSLLVESKTNKKSSNTKEEIISPFTDVATGNKYFESINTAYKRGMIAGRGDGTFAPDDYLTTADAITILVKALGLEGLAPSSGAVTVFRDSDEIPGYARNSVYVAHRIGLVMGDDKGYLKPNEYITKGRAAVIINNFIDYMRNDLKKDYRERIVNY
ncbi:MAG TPA: S-layer homology domain-containing protein [Acetivibrio sp.]|uniref:S-layer homology domain-containing protein n=1 Tax=Acetivibrio sp. TaxID=1872092 RepID=UPI002C1A5886|nr:S-layer homology domain-containing protein [Acetivibrio sp.]HOM02227.1 S-layer homology domain-containing protein [Acetivibrio sp.]